MSFVSFFFTLLWYLWSFRYGHPLLILNILLPFLIILDIKCLLYFKWFLMKSKINLVYQYMFFIGTILICLINFNNWWHQTIPFIKHCVLILNKMKYLNAKIDILLKLFAQFFFTVIFLNIFWGDVVLIACCLINWMLSSILMIGYPKLSLSSFPFI